MTAQRDIRVWDSSVIIAYLGNEIAYRDVLLNLIEQGNKAPSLLSYHRSPL